MYASSKKTLESNIEINSKKIEFINSAVGYKEKNIKLLEIILVQAL